MELPKTLKIKKPPSPKQRKQWKLRHALGTTVGFYGWINNLEARLKDAEHETPETRAMHIVCNVLRKQLVQVEKELRVKLKNIP